MALGDKKSAVLVELEQLLERPSPARQVELTIQRDGSPQEMTATLGRQPLEVIRPEFDSKPSNWSEPDKHDPFSFLLTLQQVDEQVIAPDGAELPRLNLYGSEWEVVAASQDAVTFNERVPKWGIEIEKTYRLEKVPADQMANPDFPAYHLWLDVKLANVGGQARQVAYRLDGPTGLPIEGAWYANKVSQGSMFSAAGCATLSPGFEGGKTTQVTRLRNRRPRLQGRLGRFAAQLHRRRRAVFRLGHDSAKAQARATCCSPRSSRSASARSRRRRAT